MATPTWFIKEQYLQSKLAQLVASGDGSFTLDSLDQAITDAGYTAYTHFQTYSLQERTSPNNFFNANEYLAAKAEWMMQSANGWDGVTVWTADMVAQAIKNAGIATIWDHFAQYGWKEGVNPSNSFDVSDYFATKLAALQVAEPEVVWTYTKMISAFEAANLDPVTHYLTYGINEAGVVVAPVVGDEAVDLGAGVTLSLEAALAAYNADTLPAAFYLEVPPVANFGVLSVDQATALEIAVNALVPLSLNAAEVDASEWNVQYALLDTLANLTALQASNVDLFSGAASYTLSDASLTAAALSNVTPETLASAQSAAVADVRANPIVDGATNGDTIPVNNGVYTLLDGSVTAAELNVSVAGLAAAQDAAVLDARATAVVAGAANGATMLINDGAYSLLDTAANLAATAAQDEVAGAAAVAVSGNANFAQADAIAAAASGVVTATVVRDIRSVADGTGAPLTEAQLSQAFVRDLLELEPGNAWSFAVTGERTAAELLALDAHTTATYNATGVTQITGNVADIKAVDAAAGINLPSAYAIVVTGNASVQDLADLDLMNGAGTLTYTTVADTAPNLAANAGAYVTGAVNVEVQGTATIAQIAAIDGFTTGTVAYDSVTDTQANIAAALARVATADVNVTDATITAAQANAIAAASTGVVTATVTAGTAADLVAALGNADDALTLTVSAGPVAAVDLNALYGKTSVAVNAAAVTAVSGSAAEFDLLLTAEEDGEVTLPANFNATVTGAISVQELAALDAANGTGTLTYTAVTDTADVLAANAAGYVKVGTVVTVSDAATLAQLLQIDSYNGLVGLNYTTVTDTAANLATNAGGYVTGAVNVEVQGTATIAQIAAIDGFTTGTVAYDSVTDTQANIAAALARVATADVNVTDATITAAQANVIAAASTGVVTATVTAGAAANLVADLGNAAFNDALTLTVSAGAVAAVDLNALYGKTSVAVNAAAVTAVSGSAAEFDLLLTAEEDGEVTLPANFDATVTGAISVQELAALNAANGTGTLAYTDVIGSGTELATLGYVKVGTNATVDGPVSLAQLLAIDGFNGLAGALNYTEVTDTAANLAANAGAYVTGAVNVEVQGTATIAQIAAIDGFTTGTVAYDSVTDTQANIAAALARVATADVNVTDATITAAQANAIAAASTGVVTATVTAGTAAALVAALGNADDALTLTVSAGPVAAVDLNALYGKTSVAVNAAAVTAVSGSAAEFDLLLTAEEDGEVTLPANFDATVTGAISVQELAALNAANGTGTLAYTDVTGNAADLLSSGFVTGGINVTVNDALTIAQMAALDAANGLGTITLLSGFADSYANLAANVGGYVAVDNVEVTDGAITVAQAHVLQALTSGAVIADVSTTAIADLVSLNDTNGADAGGVEAGNLFSVQMSMADIEAYAASNVMINLALDTVIKVVNSIAANTQAITITGDEYSREMDFSVLTGNAGNGITLNGGARHDIITGSGNDDVINGDAGNDTITGGAGDDVITGGAGADVITGGDGADDITGGAGVDLIDLSELVDITDTVVAGLVADGIDEISNIDLFSGPGTIDFVDFTNTTVATDAAQGDFAAPIALSTADTVESFEISNGLVTLFDEATGVGTTELFAVNGADIAAIIAALSGVVTNEALAFKVDADDNGVADGTVVLSENGAGVEAVYLTDVVVVGVADFPIGPGNAFIA